MQFKGKVWGEPFPVVKAASQVEVFQGLATAGVDDEDARCWVLVKSTKGPYWLELELEDAAVFQCLVKVGKLSLDEDGQVSLEFRRKPCHYPNSSPSKRADAAGVSDDLAMATTLSTLSALSIEDKYVLSSAVAATLSDPFSVLVRNSVDPFTRTPISELEDVL
jgi:hypothetical protein